MPSSQPGTFELIALELSRALQPLAERLEHTNAVSLFEELGLVIPHNAMSPALEAAVENTATSAGSLQAMTEDLISAITNGDALQIIDKGAKLARQVVLIIESFDTIADELGSLGPVPGLTPAEVAAFVAELPRRLMETVLIEYLDSAQPLALAMLQAVGLVERTHHNIGSTDPFRPDYVRNSLKLDRVGDLFESPEQVVRDVYAWGLPTFDGDLAIQNLSRLLEALGIIVTPRDVDGTQPRRGIEIDLLTIAPTEDQTPPGLEATLMLEVPERVNVEFPFDDGWLAKLTAQGVLNATTGLRIQPPANVTLITTGSAQGQLSAGIVRVPILPDPSIVLLGVAGGNGLTAKRLRLGFAVSFRWNSALGRAEGDFGFEGEIGGGKLVIGKGDSDGFLSTLLSGLSVEAGFDVGFGWTAGRGVYFTGSGALEVQLPLHVNLGPVELSAITLSVGLKGNGFPVLFSTNIKAQLGPLTAVVEQFGAIATLSFPEAGRGNLGPVNLGFGIKLPTGVGLSLDAGGFKGGGFLRLDSEKGEYVGALELDFNGLFSVKAIGIINTKMPDGKKGFSLLIVIAAEFTPIQLTFGFTLNGVGGIFGLNRRIAVAALAEGIRTNAIKSILFPENVVANITRIISDIKQFFPQQKDHFVIGPMAKLGWGTPSIITVELGLLLDLPDPMFAIVGVLKALLPNEEAPILRLQVNFIGVVDFDRGYIFFRADLFDSRLLVYSITGSMAFLVSWGEAKALALSVGGFHPDFRDIPSIPALPDGFRRMARIGISLLSDDNPRLKIESYFAITANTLQFGARAELYAEQSGFNIYGFLGFDVLFIRDPLSFVAKLSGGIALRRRSSVIAGVNISATLTGPTPWDARGKATLSFLFFSISVGFHATWGSIVEAIAGAVEDLLKVLQRELADTRNWRADLPPNNHLHVSLREIKLPAETDMLVIHPAGVLTFNQRSLPLEDFAIAKFGSKKPLAANKFKLSGANSQGQEIPADYQGVREQFAPANFLELSDSEKLSRKSFDNLPSGFKLTATADLLTTLPVVRDVEYELSYLRRERIVPRGLIKLFVLAYDRFVKGSAVRQSGLAQQQTRVSLNAPAQVGLPLEAFVIANTADLKSHVTNASGPVLFATQAEAYQRHQDLIAQNPALAGQIQVVSHFELNPN